MTAPTTCLVPDDRVELDVRRLYAGWAAGARGVVADLAASDAGPAEWPAREAVDVVAAVPRSVAVDREAAARARREGWLLGPSATDEAARRTSAGPAAGLALRDVTVAVKDVIDVAGLATGNGALSGDPRTPVTSAAAWTALEAAGARCVGKAATHEWAWGVTTPQVANPLDEARIAGGSSGGSAAAVAAGAATAGLGTDTGGSIRIPSALCGVVGIKPTHGSVDVAGVTPLAPDQDVVGPLARDVVTAAALLQVLLGRECLPASTDVRAVRVGFLARPGRLQSAVARDHDRVLRELSAAGADVVPLDTPLPRHATAVSLATMLVSSAGLYADRVEADPRAFGPSTRALMTLGRDLVPLDDLRRARQALVAATAELFVRHDLDVILTPTTPCVAPVRGAASVVVDGREEPVDAALTRFTAWASATGLPAVATPAGPDRLLPTSVQVLAPPHREAACLQIARFVEHHRPNQK